MLNRCCYMIRKCERKKLKINFNMPNEAKKLRRNPLQLTHKEQRKQLLFPGMSAVFCTLVNYLVSQMQRLTVVFF